MRKLAESKNYSVWHEYEAVLLLIRDGRKIVIGDFYGDPEVAIIDAAEKWCAVGGCGLIVYWFKEPFVEYRYGVSSPQYLEFNRHRPDIWWVENLKQLGPFDLEIQVAGGATHNISFHRTL